MSDQVVIAWEQVKMSGKPLDHWLAFVVSPVRTVSFASVNMRVDGTWKVNITPRGRGLLDPVIYSDPYRTREKAMAHAERWGRAHWGKLPLEGPCKPTHVG